jgi:hypothetical protein
MFGRYTLCDYTFSRWIKKSQIAVTSRDDAIVIINKVITYFVIIKFAERLANFDANYYKSSTSKKYSFFNVETWSD